MAMPHRIQVRLGARRYDVLIGAGNLNRFGTLVKRMKLGTHAVILSNATILQKYGRLLHRSLARSGLPVRVIRVADTERSKSMESLTRVLNQLADEDGPGRRLFLILAGGGVVGDLGGLAAGLYRRGIPYVQLPTTLLAQVDSSIGGKTAVDLAHGKNLVGLIVQPKLVFIELRFLKTLPERQFRSGLAEVAKSAVIGDAQLFRLLERTSVGTLRHNEKLLAQVVARTVKVKASIVERDELESRGIRTLLNFGHTLGHAVEAASDYRRTISHGEAVALGMLAATSIARKLGLIGPSAAARIQQLIRHLGLPVRLQRIKTARLYQAMAHDKKWFTGKNRWVLPTGIGRARVVQGVPARLIRESIRSLREG